jgi:hypothetical protein
MEPDREELRTDLLAMLNAAPELPQDDRGSLADVFLDKLQAGYQVIPRTRAESVRPVPRQPRPLVFPGRAAVIAGFLFLMFMSMLWMTVMSVGAGHWHHPPVFLFPLLVLLVLRLRRGRPGGWYRYAPR